MHHTFKQIATVLFHWQAAKEKQHFVSVSEFLEFYQHVWYVVI